VHTRLASRNLQSLNIAASTRQVLDGGLYALTIGTSWSRIEAGFHFPADTLVGMALGNFMASFFNDAFLGLQDPSAALTVSTLPDGAQLQWRVAF
jgi:membrane-associated phospholipid phosphatase